MEEGIEGALKFDNRRIRTHYKSRGWFIPYPVMQMLHNYRQILFSSFLRHRQLQYIEELKRGVMLCMLTIPIKSHTL